ncbi:2-polyprenyl-6-methoxyphenol hydroxylase [Microbacterium sp. cf046]|uniref:FAD-dependent oxidoreductase n=1 Tax=Microbacterium sp. cf046 TaxID=1761803 RepID=UPI0008E62094|nr:NAD(P)/FAD-dependent oxidoreductase [Microbacterium sp. cf046]SFR86408.1 2-polyprenyl-6-methoxyphenol hydroxylase [Microbacterium sp. cf046]
MTDVVVVGAGPVGALLAAELVRHGVDVRLLERRVTPGLGTRAIGVHAPVLAALEESGITERLLENALRVPRGEARSGDHVLGIVRFDRLSARFPFVATLPQADTEAVLADVSPAAERGAEVTSVRVRGTEVDLEVNRTDGTAVEVTAPIVVLAGGWTARPLVYRDVPTTTYPDRYLMSDIVVGDRPDADTAIVNLAPGGVLESFPLPGSMRRVVAWDAAAEPAVDLASVRVQRLQAALRARGEASVADAVETATAFGVRRVCAPRLRRGRLFVIGDTAHEVSPIGGQGMNLGLLDAAGLAPLLARWVHEGTAPEAALAAWEQRRVRSATRAGRLAAVNTVLGRPRRGVTDLARRAIVRGMLMPPLGRGFAWAYAMGLDAGP